MVSDVSAYPRFLPGCQKAAILSEMDNVIEARLNIAKGGVKVNFSTRNVMVPGESIHMVLLEGPFHHLDGKWTFKPLGKTGCKISLNIDFETSGSLVEVMKEKALERATNTVMDAFCRRAEALYGN
ncbi:Persistence and stress-resistance toxin PasT [invertebrate metagenome]|uniref:Persistence and stress-resistance toxin PasT n=1 Tax=invertebrate metagenome TaxID=1711999 RepID=A0A2H9T2R5_9ZZZZ